MLESKDIDVLNDAVQDEQFVDALRGVSTEAEFADVLSGKGVELSTDEAKECFDIFMKGKSENGSELDADSLDAVSGGASGKLFKVIYWLSRICVCYV